MEVWRGLLVLSGLFSMMIDIQGRGSEARLVENFYSSSCPNVESIVKQAVTTKLTRSPITIPGTLRLFFHDCFIEVRTMLAAFQYSSISSEFVTF